MQRHLEEKLGADNKLTKHKQDPSVHLQSQKSNGSSQSSSTHANTDTASRALVVGRTTGSRSTEATGLGLRSILLASTGKVVTLDNRALERVESITIDILSRLKVESTTNIVKLGEFNISENTRKVNGTTNRGEGVETINLGELGVVGKLEGSSNVGERVRGNIGQLGAANESK